VSRDSAVLIDEEVLDAAARYIQTRGTDREIRLNPLPATPQALEEKFKAKCIDNNYVHYASRFELPKIW
jgi:hypothetical protein